MPAICLTKIQLIVISLATTVFVLFLYAFLPPSYFLIGLCCLIAFVWANKIYIKYPRYRANALEHFFPGSSTYDAGGSKLQNGSMHDSMFSDGYEFGGSLTSSKEKLSFIRHRAKRRSDMKSIQMMKTTLADIPESSLENCTSDEVLLATQNASKKKDEDDDSGSQSSQVAIYMGEYFYTPSEMFDPELMKPERDSDSEESIKGIDETMGTGANQYFIVQNPYNESQHCVVMEDNVFYGTKKGDSPDVHFENATKEAEDGATFSDDDQNDRVEEIFNTNELFSCQKTSKDSLLETFLNDMSNNVEDQNDADKTMNTLIDALDENEDNINKTAMMEHQLSEGNYSMSYENFDEEIDKLAAEFEEEEQTLVPPKRNKYFTNLRNRSKHNFEAKKKLDALIAALNEDDSSEEKSVETKWVNQETPRVQNEDYDSLSMVDDQELRLFEAKVVNVLGTIKAQHRTDPVILTDTVPDASDIYYNENYPSKICEASKDHKIPEAIHPTRVKLEEPLVSLFDLEKQSAMKASMDNCNDNETLASNVLCDIFQTSNAKTEGEAIHGDQLTSCDTAGEQTSSFGKTRSPELNNIDPELSSSQKQFFGEHALKIDESSSPKLVGRQCSSEPKEEKVGFSSGLESNKCKSLTILAEQSIPSDVGGNKQGLVEAKND